MGDHPVRGKDLERRLGLVLAEQGSPFSIALRSRMKNQGDDR